MMNPSIQEVTLSGSAVYGIGPPVAELRSLPQRVRLGRVRPAALPAVPRFRSFFDPSRMTVAPPASINRRDGAAQALARMYLNDRLGCCVISGKAHYFGLVAGAKGHLDLEAADKEIQTQYVRVCGPGDRGCVITQVLDYCRTQGFLMGGRPYKIDGYVACDWTNWLEMQVVQYLFGASTIGINLPQAWTQNAVWDVTTSPIVGGHDVTPIDYDEKGVYVSSWGRVYLITRAAFTSNKWLEEYYALLAPLWYGQDNVSPSGVDVASLKAALDSLAHGELPPLPGPSPVPPNPTPIPPAPGGIAYQIAYDASGKPLQTFVPKA